MLTRPPNKQNAYLVAFYFLRKLLKTFFSEPDVAFLARNPLARGSILRFGARGPVALRATRSLVGISGRLRRCGSLRLLHIVALRATILSVAHRATSLVPEPPHAFFPPGKTAPTALVARPATNVTTQNGQVPAVMMVLTPPTPATNAPALTILSFMARTRAQNPQQLP